MGSTVRGVGLPYMKTAPLASLFLPCVHPVGRACLLFGEWECRPRWTGTQMGRWKGTGKEARQWPW